MSSKTPLDPRENRKRRREWIVALFLVLILIGMTVLAIRMTQSSGSLPFVNSIFFFGLLNINVLLIAALVWLVSRNIGKLFLERRSQVLGARLKSKLVVAFLSFSLVPTLVLFIVSSLYINSSFDKWFSLKVQSTFESAISITGTYYKNAEHNSFHFAEHLARQISNKFDEANETDSAWLTEFLETQRSLLALHSVEFYPDSLSERWSINQEDSNEIPTFFPRLSFDLLERALQGEKLSIVQSLGQGDVIRCLVPVYSRSHKTIGILSVNTFIPVSLLSKADEITEVYRDYQKTNPLKYPIKTAYFVILIMITLVILFGAVWMGLYLARELTVPVEKLVKGAEEVGAGNLNVHIEANGQDEISVLIQSFNQMTRDLRDNQTALVKTQFDSEKRKIQLEAVLANIGTGVVVVDSAGLLTTFNRAASKLLNLDSNRTLGQSYQTLFTGDLHTLKELVQRALNQTSWIEPAPTEFTQFYFKSAEETRSLAAIASSLKDSESNWGVVLVIDDMTPLIKNQREMAWREVARRIAHEIKNPLTPIKLSAQRLQRKLSHYPGRDGLLLKECTDTIIQHTDELKEMVNEFSSFARLPEVNPTPNELNAALTEVVSLYTQAHPKIQFIFSAEQKLPVFEFDRDQIKRVMINLLDNAVAAISQKHRTGILPEIRIETHYNSQLHLALITVSDKGPGMTEEVRARVFEPYFSTKQEGTGLGLSIAKRIINDHNGYIRVSSKEGEGTQFFIEIPLAPKAEKTLI